MFGIEDEIKEAARIEAEKYQKEIRNLKQELEELKKLIEDQKYKVEELCHVKGKDDLPKRNK